MPKFQLDVMETRVVKTTYLVEAETLCDALTTEYWVNAMREEERERRVIRRSVLDFASFDPYQEPE